MAEKEPVITLSVQDFRRAIADAIGQVQYGGGSIEITKNGKTAAYLVSPELFARLADANAAMVCPRHDEHHPHTPAECARLRAEQDQED